MGSGDEEAGQVDTAVFKELTGIFSQGRIILAEGRVIGYRSHHGQVIGTGTAKADPAFQWLCAELVQLFL